MLFNHLLPIKSETEQLFPTIIKQESSPDDTSRSLTSYDSGVASLVDPEDDLTRDSDDQRCVICRYKCPHKNYGIYACNACAAFFRRTIKMARSYSCARGKRCRVDFGMHKRTCRYCRFKRCVAVGMSIGYILTRHNELEPSINQTPISLEDGLLKRLTDSFCATFVNRFHASAKSYERIEGTLVNTTNSMFAEFDVMLRYLRHTGIQQFLGDDREMITLGGRLFYAWYFIQGCWTTLRNSGHRQNTIYFTDESSIELTAAAEERYVGSTPNIKDPKYVAHSLYNLHRLGLAGGIKFHNACVDMNDFAFICQIVSLQAAIKLFPWKHELHQQQDTVFKAVSAHYDQNYRDVPVRLGNLILLIDQVQEFVMNFEEWVVTLKFHGINIALEKILDSWSVKQPDDFWS